MRATRGAAVSGFTSMALGEVNRIFPNNTLETKLEHVARLAAEEDGTRAPLAARRASVVPHATENSRFW